MRRGGKGKVISGQGGKNKKDTGGNEWMIRECIHGRGQRKKNEGGRGWIGGE